MFRQQQDVFNIKKMIGCVAVTRSNERPVILGLHPLLYPVNLLMVARLTTHYSCIECRTKRLFTRRSTIGVLQWQREREGDRQAGRDAGRERGSSVETDVTYTRMDVTLEPVTDGSLLCLSSSTDA